MSASTKSGWSFVDPYTFSAPIGWSNVTDSSSSKYEVYDNSYGNNLADIFSAKMRGKITKSGPEPAPIPKWSLEGKAKGDYDIDPDELALHVMETGNFAALQGTQQIDSNWEVVTLDGTWTYNWENDWNLNIGPGGDFTVAAGRYLVTGRNANDIYQKDTADLAVYDSEFTFKKQNGICAKTPWSEIDEEEYQNTLTLTTTPEGFEDLLKLEMDSVTPKNNPKGKIKSNSSTEWVYTALTEKLKDKWPGDDTTRQWEVKFLTKIKESGMEIEDDKEMIVFSVFTFCKTRKADYPLALVYVKYKYWPGLTVGTYDAGLGDYGLTPPVSRNVTYGTMTFGSENILASVIRHENIHVSQPILLFRWAGEDRKAYMLAYPGSNPPTIPPGIIDHGFYWASQELPAYNEEINNAQSTGIDQNNDAYLNHVEAYFNFFDYLVENATNSGLLE